MKNNDAGRRHRQAIINNAIADTLGKPDVMNVEKVDELYLPSAATQQIINSLAVLSVPDLVGIAQAAASFVKARVSNVPRPLTVPYLEAVIAATERFAATVQAASKDERERRERRERREKGGPT